MTDLRKKQNKERRGGKLANKQTQIDPDISLADIL